MSEQNYQALELDSVAGVGSGLFKSAPQAHPLFKGAGEVQENPAPARVERRRRPTANADSEACEPPQRGTGSDQREEVGGSLAERGAEVAGEQSVAMQQGDLGFLTTGREDKAHALAVGHRSPDNDLGTTTDTLPRWIGGLLEQSVFRGFSGVKTVCEEHGLHEKGQISWLNARTRCPWH